jgi:hypothetical protein
MTMTLGSDAAAVERRKLLAAGFLPIPCIGKRPAPAGWQDLKATDALIEKWVKAYPDAVNTGVLCRTAPTVDIDVTDPDAAAEIEAMVFDVVGEKCAVRFGKRPKRAILFKAEKSFPKAATPAFTAPNGDACKVEILGNGQQVVVAGTHPDTKEAYVWHGELGERASLPVLTQEKAEIIISKAAEIMRARGWQEATKPSLNGATGAAAPATAAAVEFDTMYGERERKYASAALAGSSRDLAAMMKDSGRNDALNRFAFRLGTLAARGWIDRHHVEVELTNAAQACGLVKEDGIRSVRATIASGLGDGLKCPADDLDAPKAPLAPDGAPKVSEPPRSIRFSRFSEFKPSKGVRYVVKGIIPASGLCIFWGPPKCGKSFLVFDMVAHVSAGWQYRGRRVKQCAVAYCALEGQTGFEARVEAFRQAHKIDDIPLFISGDRLQLPNDGPALIASIRAQLGETLPGIVVLDTLNRSLIGSENDPADMARYVQAADAIRDAFGCVVIIVHHCGIEGTRPRGHTSLTGAADAQIKVVRDDTGNVISLVEWLKDGAEGDELVSRLETVNVGTDEDGEEVSSCVIRPAEKPKATPHGPTLTKNQATMFRILHDAGRAGLTTDEWYELTREAGIGRHRRADLVDIRSQLKAKGLVREFNGRWHVNHS